MMTPQQQIYNLNQNNLIQSCSFVNIVNNIAPNVLTNTLSKYAISRNNDTHANKSASNMPTFHWSDDLKMFLQ